MGVHDSVPFLKRATRERIRSCSQFFDKVLIYDRRIDFDVFLCWLGVVVVQVDEIDAELFERRQDNVRELVPLLLIAEHQLA